MADERDERITEYLLTRDERALELIKTVYGGYIYRVAYDMLGNKNDAEECQNDVLMSLWNTDVSGYGGRFATLVASVTRRVCSNRYRVQHRKKRVPSELTLALDELLTPPQNGERDDPEQAFFAEQLAALINGWLRTLDAKSRAVFIARYYRAAPIKTVCAVSGLSRNGVYKTLDRLKESLKNHLERNGYEL